MANLEGYSEEYARLEEERIAREEAEREKNEKKITTKAKKKIKELWGKIFRKEKPIDERKSEESKEEKDYAEYILESIDGQSETVVYLNKNNLDTENATAEINLTEEGCELKITDNKN